MREGGQVKRVREKKTREWKRFRQRLRMKKKCPSIITKSTFKTGVNI